MLHGVAGESADIVRNEKAGIVFEPENAEQLVSLLKLLRQDTESYEGYRSSCLVAAKKYDRSVLANRMLGLVTKLKYGQ